MPEIVIYTFPHLYSTSLLVGVRIKLSDIIQYSFTEGIQFMYVNHSKYIMNRLTLIKVSEDNLLEIIKVE